MHTYHLYTLCATSGDNIRDIATIIVKQYSLVIFVPFPDSL